MRPGAKERARAYLSKSAPVARAGQGGDKTTYSVACTLAVDFGLDDSDVRELLNDYNASKCEPRWADRDIERFIRSARKCAASKPGDVGKLLDVDSEKYTGPKMPSSPANNSGAKPGANASKSAQKPPSGAPKASEVSGRTPRTPFFQVRRAGDGAEPRPSRTFRTDIFLPAQVENKKEELKAAGTAPQASEASGVPPQPAAIVPAAPATPKPPPAPPTDVTWVMNDGQVWKKPFGKQWKQLPNLNEGRANRAT